MFMINLERPIVFVDFETTGVDPNLDRIVEYSFCKIELDKSRTVKSGLLNPGIPIPESASNVHGITDDMVKDMPYFPNFAKGILHFIEGCDLGGFASNMFDFPLLYAEFNRCGISWDYSQHNMIDVANIYKRKEERTLSAAVLFYCGKVLEGAHGAEADILATADVFEAQLKKYEDLPKTISELSLYSNYDRKRLDMGGRFVMADDGETILLNFGKSKGRPAKEDIGFLEWMIYKGTFPPDTLNIAQSIIDEVHRNKFAF